MNKLFLLMALVLVGCASDYQPPPPLPNPPAGWDKEPCKAQPALANADEDLNNDTATLDCTRQLRLRVFQLQDYIRNILE